jgi:hypothetical protein
MERTLHRMVDDSILTVVTPESLRAPSARPSASHVQGTAAAPSSGGVGVVELEISSNAEGHFSLLCSCVWPFIDSYWTAATTLFALQSPAGMKGISRDDLVQRMQWFAETCYHERMIEFYESCSKETLGNAVAKLQDMGVLATAVDAPPKMRAQGPFSRGEGTLSSTGALLQLRAPYDVAGHKDGHLHMLVRKIGLFRKAPLSVRANMDGLLPGAGLAADLPILAKL